MNKMARTNFLVPDSYKFIEVKGDDGIFYDLIHADLVERHIEDLTDDGYEARVIERKEVPPCKCRNFGENLLTYQDAIIDGGNNFYF